MNEVSEWSRSVAPLPVDSRRRTTRLWLAVGIAASLIGGMIEWRVHDYWTGWRRGVPCAFIHPGDGYGPNVRLWTSTIEVPAELRDSGRPSMYPTGFATFGVFLDARGLLVDLMFWTAMAWLAAARMRWLMKSVLFGAAATVLSFACLVEYCAEGNASGFPLAMIHPHGSNVRGLGVQTGREEGSPVLDLLNVLRNLLFWSGAALAVIAIRDRRETKADSFGS